MCMKPLAERQKNSTHVSICQQERHRGQSRSSHGGLAESLHMSLAHDFLIGEIRKQSTSSPSLLTLITSSGVPQTTLRVSDLLEGPTKCTESCYTHSDSLKGQIKVSQGQ